MTVDERFLELEKDANVDMTGSAVFNDELPVPFTPGSKLEIGDKLVFPASYTQVPKRLIGGKWHQFTVVKLIKADGSETTYDFFPKKFVRPLYEYELINGKAKFVTMRPHKGKAVELMTSFIGSAEKDATTGNITKSSTQKMMEELRNKTIEVKGITTIKVAKFVDGKRSETELEDDKLYTID